VRDGATAIRNLADDVAKRLSDRGLVQRLEARRITVTPNAFGNAVITFAKPFTNLPGSFVFSVWGDETTGRWATFAGGQITAQYVGTFVYDQTGGRVTSAVQMTYFVIGDDSGV
jgi:hypothetical protein